MAKGRGCRAVASAGAAMRASMPSGVVVMMVCVFEVGRGQRRWAGLTLLPRRSSHVQAWDGGGGSVALHHYPMHNRGPHWLLFHGGWRSRSS